MRFIGFVIVVASTVSIVLLPFVLGFLQLAAYGVPLADRSFVDLLHSAPSAFSIGIDFYLNPVGTAILGIDCITWLIGLLLTVNRRADRPQRQLSDPAKSTNI